MYTADGLKFKVSCSKVNDLESCGSSLTHDGLADMLHARLFVADLQMLYVC